MKLEPIYEIGYYKGDGTFVTTGMTKDRVIAELWSNTFNIITRIDF